MNSFDLGWFQKIPSRLLSALFAFAVSSSAALAAPVDGRVVAGSASIASSGKTTRIDQSTQRAIINWREFGIAADEQVQFAQPSRTSATLNRVTGDQVSRLMGQLDANGQVLLINPNGVIIGAGARIDVGSFIATTANMSDQNFMAGRLVFDEPGKPGAGVSNEGLISAADGGLVALVAPYVRNDGMIQAQLGRVALGAGDTFTIDLYGDGLINLAVDDATAQRLLEVSNAGSIEVGGGEAVLMTAGVAGGVVDSLINLSGTVLANSVSAEGGKIILAGAGADISVSGTLDASGATGGGTIHVGGEWQGGGDTPTAATTTVTETALLDASARDSGSGGEVVVWSDDTTTFAGNVLARGGAVSGDGGRMEVSGKLNLDFSGFADASAPNGLDGMLLLDPAILTVGLDDAGLISYVLSNGTNVDLLASDTININSIIDSRGKVAGGGLTMNAGNNININDFIVTNNGALNFTATAGAINIATGKGLFAGSAPITITAGGNISTGPMITTGRLSVRSTAGQVTVAAPITQANRDVSIRAALDVVVNQPLLNLRNGSDLDLVSDTGDVTVNAQIDGRGGSVGGSVGILAAQNVTLNSDVITNDGVLAVTASNGGLTRAADGTFNPTFGLFAGSADITVSTHDALNTGVFATTGALTMESTASSLTVDLGIHESTGDVSLTAATDLHVNSPVNNIRNGSDLLLATTDGTGGDIHINDRIDALDDGGLTPVAGGAVTLNAGTDVNLNETITTFNGMVGIDAGGSLVYSSVLTGDDRVSVPKRILVTDGAGAIGTAPINITTGGNLSTGPSIPNGFSISCVGCDSPDSLAAYTDGMKELVALATLGSLSLTSTGGDISVDAPVPLSIGAITLTAAEDVIINQQLLTDDQNIVITAGTGGSTGGVTVNEVDLGALLVDGAGVPDTALLDAMNANLTISALDDINIIDASGIASAEAISLTSTAGSILGSIGLSQFGSNGSKATSLTMLANQNIGSSTEKFDAQLVSQSVTGTSEEGFIRIDVLQPFFLTLTTLTADTTDAAFPAAGDIFAPNRLGNTVNINAARDIDLDGVIAGSVSLTAGRDILLDSMILSSLSATAGRDLIDVGSGTAHETTISIGGSADTILNATEGSVEFQDFATILAPSSDVYVHAGDSVILNEVQTDGGISVIADDGSITLNENLGAVLVDANDVVQTGVDVNNDGVEFLTLQANGDSGAITMIGARSAGIIDIDTTGVLTTQQQIVTLDTESQDALTIVALGGVAGDVPLEDNVPDGQFFVTDPAAPLNFDSDVDGRVYGATPMSTQLELPFPSDLGATPSPGPPIAAPPPPGAVTVSAADGGITELNFNALSAPAAGGTTDTGSDTENTDSTLNATDDFGEIVPSEPSTGATIVSAGPEQSGTGESTETSDAGDGSTAATDGSIVISASDDFELTEILVFAGGSGSADLGTGPYSVTAPPQGSGEGSSEGGTAGEEDCEGEAGCE